MGKARRLDSASAPTGRAAIVELLADPLEIWGLLDDGTDHPLLAPFPPRERRKMEREAFALHHARENAISAPAGRKGKKR